jgi:dienelactone hydrolase
MLTLRQFCRYFVIALGIFGLIVSTHTVPLFAHSAVTPPAISPPAPQPSASRPSASPATENSAPTPQFERVEQLTLTIANDPTDIYLPQRSKADRSDPLPVALLLAGALVNKAQYSGFASLVARYGFAVVVPQHERSLPAFQFSGELAEAAQIGVVLDFMTAANANPDSPLTGQVDPTRLALLGHSHGGFVGMLAIANLCIYPFCSGRFSRPEAVRAGVFYGVNSFDPSTGNYRPIPNAGIPIAMIQGSQDGISTPEEAAPTYELIQTAPKALITIAGANHYGITNSNSPTGAKPDPQRATVNSAQSIETIARWSALFLRAHVLQDADAFQYVYKTGDAADTAVEVISQP